MNVYMYYMYACVCFIVVLYRNNLGYASTCATMGQVLGIMISAVSCILLTSEDFSNKYLRITPNAGGIITMKSKTKKINNQYN